MSKPEIVYMPTHLWKQALYLKLIGRMSYLVCNFIRSALTSCISTISIQKNEARGEVKRQSSGINPCDSVMIGLKHG